MNLVTKNQETSSEDIDLLLLIERSLLFFRKFRWIFLIAAILGLSLGIFAYVSLPRIYRSRLILHSFLLTNQEQLQILGNWNNLLKSKQYAELATTLDCREDIFPSLKKMNAEEIQKVFSSDNPNGFAIDVNVTDNAILDELQKGIVYGFENSIYVKQRLAVKRAALQELIDKTSLEIQKLDSTKKILEDIISGKDKVTSPLIIGGPSINRELIEMDQKLLGFKEDLQFTNAVQVFQGFSKFPKPIGPKLIPWLVIGLLLFLPLAWVFALYSSIRQKLKERSRLRQNS